MTGVASAGPTPAVVNGSQNAYDAVTQEVRYRAKRTWALQTITDVTATELGSKQDTSFRSPPELCQLYAYTTLESRAEPQG
jgi:hypothetical protein